jgi:hypothetical protein
MTIDYSKGKIYKIEPICDHDENEIYIGSTTKEYLSQRMTKHRDDYKQWLNGVHRKVMSYDLFDKYGIDNCKITLIELCNAQSKDELTSREAFHIRTTKCLNKVIPDRKLGEYMLEYNKQDYVKEKKKNYDSTRLDYKRDHYNENKQDISEQRKIKVQCSCGCEVRKSDIAKHIKTQKHVNLMSQKEEQN